MKNADKGSGIFWMIVGILVCIESLRLGIGKWNAPRSGFLPFWTGAVLAGLSLLLVVGKTTEENPLPRIRWGRWILPLLGLIAYAFLLNYLGFILCTFALIFVLMLWQDPRQWKSGALMAALTTLASYFVFQILLKAQLPRGFLGG